ncbi:MAG: NADAR family protein [Pirellulaceae bacterium]|nr:NADAR family protein [Pirellulaceae bacterium]
MNVNFQSGRLILRGESEAETAALVAWKEQHSGHVLLAQTDHGSGMSLAVLGPQSLACREPLNVLSTHPDEQVRLISNFAATPFELEGEPYGSVEGFWQGLKFADPAERRRVALLAGTEAKNAAAGLDSVEFITWEGCQIRAGSPEHWRLMHQACWAKFSQHEAAKAALLATYPRHLQHRVRRDSRTIPGAIMADIWMRIRDKLREN